MRTELTSSRPTTALTLSDFTSAVRDVRAQPAKASPSLTVAVDLRPAIPTALGAAAEKTITAALSGRHPVDPLLGADVSVAVSILNSAVKRSGAIIEKALAASLERAGYVVLPQVSMQLSAAAVDLVANNSPSTLRGVAITTDATAGRPTVVFDLIVWCPRTRRAWLLEVKRGNGPTEIRKIKPITATLQAGALHVKAYLARMGLKVRTVEPRVVDYYGNSGFPDEVRITGDQLDRVFGASIRPLIEMVLAGIKERLFTAVPELLMRAMAAAHQDRGEAPPRTITLSGGVRVAPQHVNQIELPARRKARSRTKPDGKIIAIGGRRAAVASVPAKTQ